MIDVVELSVHFGGVVSLDQMTVQFPEGTCGLIGPNGAGKTTFFNVLSGFVRPRSGRVEAMGQDLLAMPDFKRARWGVRRTFQTEQAIEKLTVFDNVATVYEHSDNGGKAGRTAAVEEALEFVGLTAQAQQTVRTMGA
ncbi:MAG TPA: ATP-binding cassette domain-containing protein, partial [Ilumatobacteraceae bacterium]